MPRPKIPRSGLLRIRRLAIILCSRPLMTNCVECDAGIDVDEFDVDRGDQLSCPECGTNLVVVSLNPVELDLVSDDDDESEDANTGGLDQEEVDE